MKLSRRLRVEQLEDRMLLSGGLFSDVFQVGRAVVIKGTDGPDGVFVGDGVVTTVNAVEISTSFEDITDDGSDAVDFTVGESPATATFGCIAGTRGFPPGYNTGAFACITVGSSEITFEQPSDVRFFAKDIAELNPDVVGTITLVDEFGDEFVIDVPEVFTEFDSVELGLGPIVSMTVSNLDADGNATGVTNLDDFTFATDVIQDFEFRRTRIIIASLFGGDDLFVNGTGITSFVRGGGGDDLLVGGTGRDFLLGGDGDDTLISGGGRDFLFGGRGDDVIVRGRFR